MKTPRQTNRIRFVGFISVAGLLLALACTLFYFSPTGRHLRYYGEAEQIVNEIIIPFRNDLAASKTEPERLLGVPKYSELKRRVMKTDLESGELVRFHINDMFDIGVMDYGGISWHAH